MSAREAARLFIDAVLFGTEQASGSSEFTVGLNAEDRGLFQELTLGTIREWMYLDWVIAKYAPKPPRGTLRTVLNLSAYQLLFLDRVPDYAVFSQAAAISSALGVSEPELKFVHGVLKTIQKNKEKLLEIRASSLARANQGMAPESGLEWAVLNLPQPLLDALTVIEDKSARKAARVRAVQAIAAMKERARLVGYVLPGSTPSCEFESLERELTPRAKAFKSSDALNEDLRSGAIRIQGEASQWSCQLAAQTLEQNRSQKELRVLEMTAGKGGKLIGTLAAWTEIWGGNRAALPELEWWATDFSPEQIRIFEHDTLPVVQRLWPQIKVHVRCLDWRNAPTGGPQPKGFDLVWVDAPCTGFGTLAKLPQIALTRGPQAYEEALALAEVQKTLCTVGLERVKPTGVLLYSVCTLTRPETLGIVDFCVAKTGRQPLLAQALWPGSLPAPHAEGFFAFMI